MANFGDPLWGEEDWNGAPTAPFTFPPSDEERGRIDIDQVRASVKSGGKSQIDSQFVTTIGTRTAGHGGVWDEKGNWIDATSPGAPTSGPIVVFVNGAPIALDGGVLINAGSLATFLINGA